LTHAYTAQVARKLLALGVSGVFSGMLTPKPETRNPKP
jgi:hypothetical protein